MLVFEERDADVLWLLRATPRAWLKDRLAFRGASTRWGPVDLSAEPDEDLSIYRVRIRFARDRAAELRLRLRHPEDRSLAEVDVEGGTFVTVEKDGQTMTIQPEEDEIEVHARFAPHE